MNSRILVVDDTPANLQALAGTLKDKGCQISVATNGRQALGVVERVRPDLILLDGMMPEMDGFETCRRLKASPTTGDIPAACLSASAVRLGSACRRRGERQRAFAYLAVDTKKAPGMSTTRSPH